MNVPDLSDLQDAVNVLADYLDLSLADDIGDAADQTEDIALARVATAVDQAIRPVRELRYRLQSLPRTAAQ